MRLKETIRKVLNESTYFRRRVDMRLFEKEFYEVLSYVANILITKHDEGKIVKFPEFKNRVIDYLIDNYHGELSDWGREEYPYVEVYEFLSNHFKDEIKEKYDFMFNRNINESVPTQIIRRQDIFSDLFLAKRDRALITFNICDFKAIDYLFDRLVESTLDDIRYYDSFHEIASDGDWTNSVKYITHYLKEKYYEETSEIWKSQCEGKLYESENKKSGLHRAIEEDGLYQVMQDTGLSLPQIYTKTGELPREVFERYIKDYIDENGYEFEGRKNISPSIQISNLVWIDYIYTSNDGNKLFLNISEFKNGNLEDSTDEYVTSLDNIDDEEVFNIVDHMTQIDPPQLNESKTLQENEEDPTQKILNFLLRRYEIEEVDLGWGDNPIKLKMIKFDVDQGERYSISTFENKRQQIAKILDMLTTHNVIDDIDSNEGKLDPYTQKVVRAVKQFINQVMSDKSNMNETIKKEGSLLSIIKDIVEPFKEKGAVCDIDVNYDQEDDMYIVMVNFGIKNLDKIFHPVRGLQRSWYVDDIRKKVKNEIIGLMSIKNIYVGSTAVDSCNETINESKIFDKIKSFLGKKPLTKDDKLIDIIVKFIEENYSIDFESDEEGDITFYLTNDTGNWIFPPIMKYFPTKKLLNYNWKFAEDIHTWIGDDRLLQNDSEMMGKIFEKLFNKKVNKVFGFSRL